MRDACQPQKPPSRVFGKASDRLPSARPHLRGRDHQLTDPEPLGIGERRCRQAAAREAQERSAVIDVIPGDYFEPTITRPPVPTKSVGADELTWLALEVVEWARQAGASSNAPAFRLRLVTSPRGSF
jgi:hypothetical protein